MGPPPLNTHAYRSVDFSLSLEDRVKALVKMICDDPDYNGWDLRALRQAKLISATPGKTIWEVEVTPELCNKAGMLHGGCSATLLDTLSSTTFLTVAKKGFLDTGHVSRTLTMSYLRAVPPNTKVRVVAEFVSAGRTLAHCKAQIELMDGRVAVTCTHDKAIVGASKL